MIDVTATTLTFKFYAVGGPAAAWHLHACTPALAQSAYTPARLHACARRTPRAPAQPRAAQPPGGNGGGPGSAAPQPLPPPLPLPPPQVGNTLIDCYQLTKTAAGAVAYSVCISLPPPPPPAAPVYSLLTGKLAGSAGPGVTWK
jgi:hypothetical protein